MFRQTSRTDAMSKIIFHLFYIIFCLIYLFTLNKNKQFILLQRADIPRLYIGKRENDDVSEILTRKSSQYSYNFQTKPFKAPKSHRQFRME